MSRSINKLGFGIVAAVALMVTIGALGVALGVAPAPHANPRAHDQPAAGATFRSIRIEIETAAPLAAYQLELTAGGEATIVGVENGDHPAFAEAPYYDPKALGGGRIIIAAMNTGDNLPSGRTRICRLHFRQSGNVKYQAKLIAAADPEGRAIEAQLHVVEE